MRTQVIWLVILSAVGLVFVSRADADEQWMYRRSYYSHVVDPNLPPPHPVPESRSAYRTAYYNERHGFGVSTAYRFNNFVIQNGNRTDWTWYRDAWIDFQP